MTERLRTILTEETNPYRNLALEEYLFNHVLPGECILYLWQNHKTVVIGRNQNCWKECRVEKLMEDGGFVTRRLSGGGAVFHDLGNLNFTFLTKKENYDIEKQTEVILEAVKSLGICAERNGRNDLVVGDRKFSGHAYYQTGDACFHHGTILLSVDTEEMADYLSVSKEKLQSKSVDSVKSRVVNLSRLDRQITADRMKQALCLAFEAVYRLPSEPLFKDSLDQDELDRLFRKFSSWEWIYGRKLHFNYQISRRFSWGEVQIRLNVEEGKILDAALYSDMLDIEFASMLEQALRGTVHSRKELANAVAQIECRRQAQAAIRDDVADWLKESIE